MRKLALVLVGSATAALLLATQIAFAHSRPIRFDPAPGAVLTTAPAQVSGWFTSDLRKDPNWNFLKVTDAQGASVTTGDVQVSTDRRQMTVALKSGLAAGLYTVTWRSWDDADGEIFGDCYNFFVGQAAADAAVSNQTRLDAGSSCQRLEIDGSKATPTAAEVATTVATANTDTGDSGGDSGGGGSNGVSAWFILAGIAVGMVLGFGGSRVIGSGKA